jgi:Family of unknown function (DUF5681)
MNRNKQEILVSDRDIKGRFNKGVSGNPNGRPSSAEAIKQLLEPHKEVLINKAIDMALNGDTVALKICLDRVAAPLKHDSPTVEIKNFEETTLLGKADRIVCEVSCGSISIESGLKLLNLLHAYSKIFEIEDLEKRILSLENKNQIEEN